VLFDDADWKDDQRSAGPHQMFDHRKGNLRELLHLDLL
jgi:hypothetical protein